MLILKSYLQVHEIGLLFETFKNPGVVGLVSSTFRKPRLKNYEFQTSLGYMARPCLKNKTMRKNLSILSYSYALIIKETWTA